MPTLLLVDDHAIVRTGLKLIIKDFLPHGVIDEAEDGDSAFEKIKRNNYDLVIMDVNMPNTDSFGVLGNILAFKPETKIMIFSMNSEEIYAKRYLKLGAMGYLRKDSPGDEIQKAIETILNHRKYISDELGQALLLDLNKPANTKNPFEKLSTREFEIVQHLANGESISEISRKLKVHTSTIGTHKARIFEKLQCHNVVDLNKLAKVHDIIFTS